MSAQSEQFSSDVPPRSRLALAIRLFTATLIVMTIIPFAVLVGLMLFPVLPLLAFPFVVGLIGVTAGAEPDPTGPKSAGARIPARAAAPQAAPA